jgi:hypothetical protein
MNRDEIFIIIWFVVSVLLEIITSIIFYFWLRRHGVKLVFGLTGVPGYMERAYREWCHSQGRSSKGIIISRSIILLNCIMAGILFILISNR